MADFAKRGRESVERGAYAEAVRVCRLGLVTSPHDVDGRLVLGEALFALERYNEVLVEMRTLLEDDPHNPDAMVLKGRSLLAKGDALRALEWLRRARALSPRNDEIDRFLREAEASAVRNGSLPTRAPPSFEELPTNIAPATRQRQRVTSAFPDRDDESISELTELNTSGTSQTSGVIEASAARIDEMFPDEEAGVSRIVVMPEELETHVRPIESEMGDSAAAPIELISQSQHAADPGESSIGGESSTSDEQWPALEKSEDMQLIRDGLGLDQPGVAKQRAPSAEPIRSVGVVRSAARTELIPKSARPGRRSKQVVVAYALIAVVTGASSVYAGFAIRKMRLEREIHAALHTARQQAEKDTYAGLRAARELLFAVSQLQPEPKIAGNAIRLKAELVADFGATIEAGNPAQADNTANVDVSIARVWQSIGALDYQRAQERAHRVALQFPESGQGKYVLGRAAFLGGDISTAEKLFLSAQKQKVRPATLLGLGEVQAARGDPLGALAFFKRAIDMSPKYFRAIVAKARVMALSKQARQNIDLKHLIKKVDAISRDNHAVGPKHRILATLAVAELMTAHHDFSAAAEAVQRAIDHHDPSDWRYSDGLVRVLLQLGKQGHAVEVAQLGVERWPQRVLAKQSLATAKLAAYDLSGALEVLSTLDAESHSQQVDDSASVLATRARVQVARGAWSSARDDLKLAIKRAPDLDIVQLAKAEYDVAEGDAGRALKRLRALHARDDNIATTIALVAALRRTNESTLARAALEPLLQLSTNAMVQLELARLERDDGNFDAAKQAYSKAIEIQPAMPLSRVERAELIFDLGDYKAAADEITTLLDQNSSDWRILAAAARIQTIGRDLKAAETILKQMRKHALAPSWIVARERGRVSLRKNRYKRAIRHLRRAVRARPGDAETRLLLIEAQLSQKDVKGAKKTFRGMRKRFAGQWVARVASGQLQMAAKRYREAVSNLKKGQKLLLGGYAPPRLQAFVAGQLGRAQYLRNSLRSAESTLDHAIALNASDPVLHHLRGLVAFGRKDWAKAAAFLTASLALDPLGDPESWYYLGRTAFAVKDFAGARKSLRKFIAVTNNKLQAKEARALLAKVPPK